MKEKGLRLVVDSMTIDCRADGKMDIMTETTLKIMSVFSELEKQMISERVKSGMENARDKGKTLGRPATKADDIPSKFMESYNMHRAGKLNVTDLSRMNGMSRTTVYKYISLIEEHLKD